MGAIVIEGKRHGGDAPTETALLKQRPDHVGTSARPPADGRGGVGRQPQRFDIQHEGIAAALEPVVERVQWVDVGFDRKGPEDLLPGQEPLGRPGNPLKRFADGLARKRGNDPERRFQTVRFLARKVVIVVAPAGSQSRVLRTPIRQRRLRILFRQPAQRRGEIDQLHAHGRRERQRRRARIRPDDDIELAPRMSPTKLLKKRRAVRPPPRQPAIVRRHQRIQPHVVVDDPDHGAGTALGERIQI